MLVQCALHTQHQTHSAMLREQLCVAQKGYFEATWTLRLAEVEKINKNDDDRQAARRRHVDLLGFGFMLSHASV